MVYPGTSVSCLHDSNHTAEGEEEGEELVCAFATGVAHGSHKMLFPEKPESFYFFKGTRKSSKNSNLRGKNKPQERQKNFHQLIELNS